MRQNAPEKKYSRRRSVCLSGLLAAGLVGSVCAQLACDAPVFDFGIRPDSERGIGHGFELYNRGGTALTIESVRSSCDCLVAALDRRSLRPQERIPLDVYFDFDGESGPQERTVRVVYRPENEPAEAPVRILTLQVTGTILTPVLCEPGRIDLGTVLPGSTATASVHLISGRVGPFSLRAVQVIGGGEAQFEAGVEAVRHPVVLRIPVPPDTGRFSGAAVAATDLEEMPMVRIVYTGESRPVFDVRPSMLNPPLEGALDTKIEIRSPHGDPFIIRSVTATDPAIHLSLTQNGALAQIAVTSDPGARRQEAALIRLTTDHPVSPVIEIPIRPAAVRSGSSDAERGLL